MQRQRSLPRRETQSHKEVRICIPSSLFLLFFPAGLQKATKNLGRCVGWGGDNIILADPRNQDARPYRGCPNDLTRKNVFDFR